MDDDIKVTFIIPSECVDENACSQEMQLAFISCEQHRGGGLQSLWLHERKCTNFEGLTKKDVFVLNKFDGPLFDKLKTTKCLLIGPRCLSCCLTEGTPIPSGPEPVFTVAMRGLFITASGLTKNEKDKIKERVQWMGGTCSPVLTDVTTHLVSNTVLSDKYIKSIGKGIPVMAMSWVDDVWETSLQRNVNGSSPEFLKHQLPPFANLEVTTSGLDKKEKQRIVKLVNEYGGKFSGPFQSETTDIVVITKANIVGNEKYKAALEYNKVCVVPAWIYDSVSRGVALPVTQYKVTGTSTSSPLPQHNIPDMSLNFSRITNVKPSLNFVDETRSTDCSTSSGKIKVLQDFKRPSDPLVMYKEIVDLSLNDIKKAGPIFDGLSIWVTGPEGQWRERACACVSRCGGVRYDAAHERVTHVVAAGGQAARAARLTLPRVSVLTPLWLSDSVRAKRALPENDYLIEGNCPPSPSSALKDKPEPASPMSKRNLQLLLAPRSLSPPAAPSPPHEPPNDHLLQQYLSQNVPEVLKEKSPPSTPRVGMTPDLTEMEEEPTNEMEQIFQGLKIEVQGLDEEALCEVGAEVTGCGGVLAAAGAGAGGTHVLVPLDFDINDVINKDAEPITVFWIKDCLSEQELVPLQYYHRPVLVSQRASECLSGVVVTLSTYSGVERAFLDELAKLLGAKTQLRFCRRNTAKVQASTHLLCPEPVGDKYTGAVKWGLPAVTAHWLLDTAARGERLHEGPYLVGDTKAPESSIEPRTDIDIGDIPQVPVERSSSPKQPLPTDVDTPLEKPTTDNDCDNMSPASRYIAMARQGLLGGDTQDTPKRVQQLKQGVSDQECGIRTPPLDDALSTPNLKAFSPNTQQRLQAVRRGEMTTRPISTPTDPFSMGPATPHSGFGAALRPDGRLSSGSRKRLMAVVQALPGRQEDSQRQPSTPLSEIRNRYLAHFNNDSPLQAANNLAPRKLQLQDQVDTPPAKISKFNENQTAGSRVTIHNENEPKLYTNSVESTKSAASSGSLIPAGVELQLERLNAALSECGGTPSGNRIKRQRESLPRLPPQGLEQEAGPVSQPNTVGWDDTTPAERSPHTIVKRFMFSSNVNNREEIIEMILSLGGEVSESAELNLSATHLLCAAPTRSEKMLGSIATGKWVLHPLYIYNSHEQGAFLPEEDYEWGNPSAVGRLPALSESERVLMAGSHRWRVVRGAGGRGAYAGLRVILHVPSARRRLLRKLLQAGDGESVDVEPPYSSEDVSGVNLCLIDVKRYPLSTSDAALLNQHRIPICSPFLLNTYLTNVNIDPKEHCLPEYRLDKVE